jgi:hypothetical protein
MTDETTYRKLSGRVYYKAATAKTGIIKIITFGELSEEETEGLSVVPIDPIQLIAFMTGEADASQYFLLFNDKGVVTLVKRAVEVQLALYEEVLRPVHLHNNEPGLVVTVDGLGSARVEAHNLPEQIYPDSCAIVIYVTKLNQPNLVLSTLITTLGSIVNEVVVLGDFPVGFPVSDYSLWCISAGPLTPVWWRRS